MFARPRSMSSIKLARWRTSMFPHHLMLRSRREEMREKFEKKSTRRTRGQPMKNHIIIVLDSHTITDCQVHFLILITYAIFFLFEQNSRSRTSFLIVSHGSGTWHGSRYKSWTFTQNGLTCFIFIFPFMVKSGELFR
jgi:hypothetical protein